MKCELLLTLMLAAVFVGVNAGDVPNKTRTDNFFRPCPSPITKTCLQTFIQRHGGCPKSDNNDSIHRPLQYVYLAKFNLTVKHINTIISNLAAAEVTDLYHNLVSNNVVMVVDFTKKGVSIDVQDSYFYYHSIGREPVVTHDKLFAQYDIINTLIIPMKNDRLDFEEMMATAYFIDSQPKFKIGPKYLECEDKEDQEIVDNTHRSLKSHLSTALQETMYTEALSFANAFIETLCNLNLSVSCSMPHCRR